MTGRLIALVGTSSAGKSTAAAHLQPMLPTPHLVVGIDLFLNMFPQHWHGHPRGPGEGMWYEESIDPDGSPRSVIRYGEAGARLLEGMCAAVLALLDAGNDVILDEMPIDASILPAWRRVLGDRSCFWVHLQAPLDVLERREALRTHGQKIGNARGHLGNADDQEYDLVIDVSQLTPGDVAARIARAVNTARE